MQDILTLRDIRHFSLHARDGEIGKLAEVYFDDRRWIVRYLVVRTGNWLTGYSVLIHPSFIAGFNREQQSLDVALTREQIRKCPSVESKLPVSQHYEREYFRYYGMEPYWVGDPMFGTMPHVPAPSDSTPREPENPHLRSSDEVTGYAVAASDGEFGQVADFILELPDWAVRFLEIDTRRWLPGKHVLIAPAWISAVNWEDQSVSVDLSCEAIKSAPPYRTGEVISHEYQVELYSHYGKNYQANDV